MSYEGSCIMPKPPKRPPVAKYELLWECYKSEQIPPDQWAKICKDEVFQAWLKRRLS